MADNFRILQVSFRHTLKFVLHMDELIFFWSHRYSVSCQDDPCSTTVLNTYITSMVLLLLLMFYTYICHNAPVTLHVYTPLLIWIKYLLPLRPQYLHIGTTLLLATTWSVYFHDWPCKKGLFISDFTFHLPLLVVSGHASSRRIWEVGVVKLILVGYSG